MSMTRENVARTIYSVEHNGWRVIRQRDQLAIVPISTVRALLFDKVRIALRKALDSALV
jgi:hypothetical protein